MRLWFRLWSGHLVLALTIGLLLLGGWFLLEMARSERYDRMFIFFVLAVVTLLLATIVGIAATALYKTWTQRRYIRREDALVAEVLTPLSEDTRLRWIQRAEQDAKAASEAQGAAERG
jgi:hypothetical protein